MPPCLSKSRDQQLSHIRLASEIAGSLFQTSSQAAGLNINMGLYNWALSSCSQNWDAKYLTENRYLYLHWTDLKAQTRPWRGSAFICCLSSSVKGCRSIGANPVDDTHGPDSNLLPFPTLDLNTRTGSGAFGSHSEFCPLGPALFFKDIHFPWGVSIWAGETAALHKNVMLFRPWLTADLYVYKNNRPEVHQHFLIASEVHFKNTLTQIKVIFHTRALKALIHLRCQWFLRKTKDPGD